jgi:hypothetical protein
MTAAEEDGCGLTIGAAQLCATGDFRRIRRLPSSHEEGLVMEAEIEFVARALHAAEDDVQLWDQEPDTVKDEFRTYALAALEMLEEHRRPEMFDAETCPFPYAA